MTDFTSDRVKRALAWIGDSADAQEALDAAEEILPAARSIINKTAKIFQQYTN